MELAEETAKEVAELAYQEAYQEAYEIAYADALDELGLECVDGELQVIREAVR
jgi:hypothetical protein